jgi:hypothetical protein
MSSNYRQGVLWRLLTFVSERVDQRKGWHKLPLPVALPVLVGIRTKLRQKNLFDTGVLPSANEPQAPQFDATHRTQRTSDGSWNDLSSPSTGMAGTRFGRNVPLDSIPPSSDEDVLAGPSPREVSRRLMTRHELIAAEGVNALAAAWLQFMIHDWFSHGKSPKENPWVIDLADDDPWPDKPMKIMRTMPDPTRPEGSQAPGTHVNVLTHWWDASQIYGESAELTAARRSHADGKLLVNEDGSLPWPTNPDYDPSRVPGFWAGLAMLITLFTHEHNAICDQLRASYPAWGDEEMFQRARLINSALLAKIHTVEWTPAIISHPTTVYSLRANWFGIQGERTHKLFGRLSRNEVVSGIPGAKVDHFGVPFSLTEDFVAVYRMHPLIRDEWSLRRLRDDSSVRDCTFADLTGPEALSVITGTPMPDLFYSFGTQPPGLVTLHNYPRHMQEFHRPDGFVQDLAATDILRCRELGVPRYNEFRRLMHLKPCSTFEELVDDPAWAEEISDVYNGQIEEVDLPVGLYAERRPKGFAFSDTAFRIFVLMASRRLNSDRFFTDYYTPEVYTQVGLDWITDNSMKTVLLRHHPELRPALHAVANGFNTWERP